ncbi:hypothetical protein MASR2M70_16470 [Bacillota bacterium]
MTWFSKRMNSTGLIAGVLSSAVAFYLCAYFFHIDYPMSMIISMGVNFLAAHLVSFAGLPPAEDTVENTYYFSSKFANIPNVPR